MTTDDLVMRGFVEHVRLGTFFGWCGFCKTYRSIAWWAAPKSPLCVTACKSCRHVPVAEQYGAEQFPVVRHAA